MTFVIPSDDFPAHLASDAYVHLAEAVARGDDLPDTRAWLADQAADVRAAGFDLVVGHWKSVLVENGITP